MSASTTPPGVEPAPARRRLQAHAGLWFGLALLLANLLAWLGNLQPPLPPPAAARLDPALAALRQTLIDGATPGERFEVVLTDQSASEAIAWFLTRHPNVPFSHPQVLIHPDGVEGRGIAHVLGLSTPVSGRARVTLDPQGLPQVALLDLRLAGAGAPGFVLEAIEAEIYQQVDFSQGLMVEFTRVEWGEGQVLIEGVFK